MMVFGCIAHHHKNSLSQIEVDELFPGGLSEAGATPLCRPHANIAPRLENKDFEKM